MEDDAPPSRARPRVALRTAATEIVRTLSEAGFEAYFAGGCVRDRLMGLEPQDYDVATAARPEDIGRLFRKAQSVGESFGVMLVRSKGHSIEVSTFRTEGVYSDGRHPDEVRFSDALHDATRRDFTINGLFENPLTGQVIDLVGGQEDLHAKRIRAIGDPEARLREDRLRMLRAVRFAARFGFEIEEATAEAIRSGAEQLQGISRERIGQEVRRMLGHPSRAVAAWSIQYLGLDAPVLMEGACTNSPMRLGRLPDATPLATALAAWAMDRHEDAAADPAPCVRRWSGALILSNAEQEGMSKSLEIYLTLRSGRWSGLGVAAQKRLAAGEWFQQALAIFRGVDVESFVEVQHQVAELARSGLAPTPLIDGSDLIALGIAPGPVFKRILHVVYDAQLEGAVRDKAQALELAKLVAGGSLD